MERSRSISAPVVIAALGLSLSAAISSRISGTGEKTQAVVTDASNESREPPKPTVRGKLPPLKPTEASGESVDLLTTKLSQARNGDADAASSIVEMLDGVDESEIANSGIPLHEFRIFKIVSDINKRETDIGADCIEGDMGCVSKQDYYADIHIAALLRDAAAELPDGPFDPLFIKLLGLENEEDLRRYAAQKSAFVVNDWSQPHASIWDDYRDAFGIDTGELPK